jgi:hypothetical protein
MYYPLLADIYGNAFDPSNQQSKKLIKPLMSEIMCFTDASRQGINVKDYACHVISFLHVPNSSSDKSFDNSKSWVDEALQINGSAHNGTFESAFRVANHLHRFYGDSVCKALNKQGMFIAQEMSTVKYVTMLSALKSKKESCQDTYKNTSVLCRRPLQY